MMPSGAAKIEEDLIEEEMAEILNLFAMESSQDELPGSKDVHERRDLSAVQILCKSG